MASAATIDLEPLLAPILEEQPNGTPLRYEGTYDAIRNAIKELRQEADNLPADSVWTTIDVKTASWNSVIATATQALAQKSKDLQIAAWLAEALATQYGFPGLRDGLQLLRGLQERFWDSLYPEMENGDVELRTGLFDGLNSALPLTIKRIALTRSSQGDLYTLLHWEDAARIEHLARQERRDVAEVASEEAKATTDELNKAVSAMPRAFYESLFEDLQQCREQYEQLASVTDTNFGRSAPSLLNVKKAIDDCYDIVRPIRKAKREREGLKEEVDTATQGPVEVSSSGAALPYASSTPVPVQPAVSGSLTLEPHSREDALQRLQAVAAYFRCTEPHSPVSYLVQRAARWGTMPLEQWLQDVIKDQGVLDGIWETLGIKAATPNGEVTANNASDAEAES